MAVLVISVLGAATNECVADLAAEVGFTCRSGHGKDKVVAVER